MSIKMAKELGGGEGFRVNGVFGLSSHLSAVSIKSIFSFGFEDRSQPFVTARKQDRRGAVGRPAPAPKMSCPRRRRRRRRSRGFFLVVVIAPGADLRFDANDNAIDN